MNFNTDEVKKQLDREFDEYLKSIKKTNILVLGQTGVGKSSLLNMVFGEEVAEISNVKPTTRGFHTFSSETVPVNIIDSEGYELEHSDEFMANLKDYVDSKFVKASEQVHLAWYCINVSSARVLPFDIENIKFLIDALKIPTAVVFTQCDLDDEDGRTAASLTKLLKNQFAGKVKTFQVSNKDEFKLDLDELIGWSENNIDDENVKASFVLAQKSNLKLKFDTAHKYIVGAAVTAAGIGATPIPIADSAALFALQIGLAYKIFTIYGISQQVGEIVKTILSNRIMSLIGKTLAGSLLKFIPGAGSIIGGAINAVVASGLTYALGYALSKMAEKVYVQILEGKYTLDSVKAIITEENLEMFLKEFKDKKVYA